MAAENRLLLGWGILSMVTIAMRYAIGVDTSNEESTQVESTPEKLVSVTFKVECTPEKLTALGEYMKANGIKYGRA